MLLEVKGIKKKYKDFQLDVDLEVREGCVTGLIGKNGAGKSTTFKAILDLIKLDSGAVFVDGYDIKTDNVNYKYDIGVVLAESGFSGYMTIKDVVAIMKATYPRFRKEQFISMCEHFKLPFDKKIKEFSTGMKAKLKILTAISYNAKLLILDEPTAGLDVIARQEVLDMLRKYMEQPGRSILISSHISSDLEGLCDDIYLIDNGKIKLYEEMDSLLTNYGVIKVNEEQYVWLDKSYITDVMKENYGYKCLTNQVQYYVENCPEVVIEKAKIDDVIMLKILGNN
ncbi:MAG: ABC transporter ATP-binding protein [Lachnospiraceae bacterium]|nr:ABC transporter ATP-binding protein [Lachnospiraceae bacterium]